MGLKGVITTLVLTASIYSIASIQAVAEHIALPRYSNMMYGERLSICPVSDGLVRLDVSRRENLDDGSFLYLANLWPWNSAMPQKYPIFYYDPDKLIMWIDWEREGHVNNLVGITQEEANEPCDLLQRVLNDDNGQEI